MYETKTVLRTWYELGWYEGWEVYGYTEFDSAGVPRMAEIRRPTPRAADVAALSAPDDTTGAFDESVIGSLP